MNVPDVREIVSRRHRGLVRRGELDVDGAPGYRQLGIQGLRESLHAPCLEMH